jgi:hypothetical protein
LIGGANRRKVPETRRDAQPRSGTEMPDSSQSADLLLRDDEALQNVGVIAVRHRTGT